MRHALVPIALSINQRYGNRNSEDGGVGRRSRFCRHSENEYPPACPVTCFAFPIMGTAVLTPESVDRVRERLRNVVEEVGEERRKQHRIKRFTCDGEEGLGKEGEERRMIMDELKASEMVLVMEPCVKEEEEEVLLCTGKVCYEGREGEIDSQITTTTTTTPSPSHVLKGKVVHRGSLRQTTPQWPQKIKMMMMEAEKEEKEETEKEVMVVDWGIPLTHRDLVSIQSTTPTPAEGGKGRGRTTPRPRGEGGRVVEGNASFVDPGRNPSLDKGSPPPHQEGGDRVECEREEEEEEEEWGKWGQFVVDDAILSQIFFRQPKLAEGTHSVLETHTMPSLSCHAKNDNNNKKSNRVEAHKHNEKVEGEEKKKEEEGEGEEEDLSCPPLHHLLPPNYILVSEIIASSLKRQQAERLNVEGSSKENGGGDGGGEMNHPAAAAPSPPTSFSSLPVNHHHQEEEEEENTIFPSYPCYRVGELLREVSEGKRPIYALCPPEYVYGKAEYIKEQKKKKQKEGRS